MIVPKLIWNYFPSTKDLEPNSQLKFLEGSELNEVHVYFNTEILILIKLILKVYGCFFPHTVISKVNTYSLFETNTIIKAGHSNTN